MFSSPFFKGDDIIHILNRYVFRISLFTIANKSYSPILKLSDKPISFAGALSARKFA